MFKYNVETLYDFADSYFTLFTNSLGYKKVFLRIFNSKEDDILFATDDHLSAFSSTINKNHISVYSKVKDMIFHIPLEHEGHYIGECIISVSKNDGKEFHIRILESMRDAMLMQIVSIHQRMKLKECNEQLEKNLKRQENNIIKMNKSRSNFLSSITHDIRTPLSLITMPLEKLIQQNKDFSMDQFMTIQKVKYNIYKVIDMISNVLDIFKIESGQMKSQWVYQDIIKFIQKMVDLYRDIMHSYQIQFKFTLRCQNIMTSFDPEKMEKIFINLLSNAIKHTPKEGSIELLILKTKYNKIQIRFKNSGKGLTKIERSSIFTPFKQIMDGRGISSLGSGLGLSISKEYVKLHEGSIWVNSREKYWAEFVVSLPILNEKKDHYGFDSMHRDFHKILQQKELSHAFKKMNEKNVPKSLEVWFITEKPDVWQPIIKSVQLEYMVRIFNRIDLLEKIKIIETVALVYCVDSLSLKWLDIVSKIKSKIRFRYIPFIMLANRSTKNLISLFLSKGVDHCIIQPFHISELLLNLQQFERQQRLRLKLFSLGMTELRLKIILGKFIKKEEEKQKKISSPWKLDFSNIYSNSKNIILETLKLSDHSLLVLSIDTVTENSLLHHSIKLIIRLFLLQCIHSTKINTSQILKGLNKVLLQDTDIFGFISSRALCLYMDHKNKSLLYSNAGNYPAILYFENNVTSFIQTGYALGVSKESVWQQKEMFFSKNSLKVFIAHDTDITPKKMKQKFTSLSTSGVPYLVIESFW